ncbi:hypothetical protein [uncultured Oxalicibacterium sp.]|uniref:hypothetical protein n=1 Tax=uncultured Oxalicibacterium sp. TaxID=1168540 RepID=UPI0025D8CAD3|nr:hypothetical protein [uncultured Oxalicibacterium sp.]
MPKGNIPYLRDFSALRAAIAFFMALKSNRMNTSKERHTDAKHENPIMPGELDKQH